MRYDPLAQQGKAEFASCHRIHDELERRSVGHVQIASVDQKKRMSRREPHPLVAIHKGVIVNQRLE